MNGLKFLTQNAEIDFRFLVKHVRSLEVAALSQQVKSHMN